MDALYFIQNNFPFKLQSWTSIYSYTSDHHANLWIQFDFHIYYGNTDVQRMAAAEAEPPF